MPIDKDLVEKIELLSKGGLKPEKIAQTINISEKQVKDYFKAKAEEEKKRQEELGFTSRFSKSIKAKKPKAAIPRDESLNEDIPKMRMLREKGYSPYTIATTFGKPFNQVYPYIKDITPKSSHREPRYNLTKEDIEQIKFMKKEGFKPDQIARFLGVTEICVVTNIKKHDL